MLRDASGLGLLLQSVAQYLEAISVIVGDRHYHRRIIRIQTKNINIDIEVSVVRRIVELVAVAHDGSAVFAWHIGIGTAVVPIGKGGDREIGVIANTVGVADFNLAICLRPIDACAEDIEVRIAVEPRNPDRASIYIDLIRG